MSAVFKDFPYRLILASTSPRRRELLGHLGLPFEVFSPSTEEVRGKDEEPAVYSQRLALEKAAAVFAELKDERALVVGSDTIGIFEEHVLEKPKDPADAKAMLRGMSGKTHIVLTAVALLGQSIRETFVVETAVTFKSLSDDEIEYYVATREPLDKAGSYGIQGIGGFMVRSIQGSYSNVVGLPLVELTEALRKCLAKGSN